MTTLMNMNAQAQSYGDEGPSLTPNRLGLVYENAIEKNEEGKVNIQRVNYMVDGIKVVANVYTPAGYDAKEKYPAITVAHPNGGSKDQVAGLYAQRLAEAGFVTIAFDARYQGESGGEPRRTDKPANRIGDICGAVDFIQQFPGVDADRIGALGICGGGGYTFAAAQMDKRIKAVATLSMFNTGDVRRNGYMRSQMGNIAERQLTARNDIPQAAAVVMQYTGYSAVSAQDAPTYANCGTSDGIASWRTMQSRLRQLSQLGIPTEFHSYQGLPHGYGLGTGTVAEGWIDDAASFWQRQIK